MWVHANQGPHDPTLKRGHRWAADSLMRERGRECNGLRGKRSAVPAARAVEIGNVRIWRSVRSCVRTTNCPTPIVRLRVLPLVANVPTLPADQPGRGQVSVDWIVQGVLASATWQAVAPLVPAAQV
jgi:hypothetical protein